MQLSDSRMTGGAEWALKIHRERLQTRQPEEDKMENTSFIALAVSFVLGVILAKVLIPVLHKMKFGQFVREEGPESHLKKSGTPTMGGVIIVAAAVIGTVPFIIADSSYRDSLPVLIFTVCFALIGLADDSLKLKKKQSEGLTSKQKMGLQIIVTAVLIIYTGRSLGTGLIIPFAGEVDFHGWYYVIAALAVLGTVNGANFTDGLDGLASSVTTVIAAFLTVAAVMLGTGITPATLAMIGALLAFLCFNAYPAKVFMGDTGSLALGGFVAAAAMMMKMPIFLIIAAFIYLAEILSVILQVGYFKLTHGKRIFRMTPIHHHFELGGWSETRIVTIFTIITVLLCVAGYIGLSVAL